MSELAPADLPLASPRRSGAAIFLPPYDRCDDDELLVHYHTRRDVEFFAVADPDETSPEKIEAIMQNRFDFVGQSFTLDDPIDWLTNPSTDVEWHILLHKFYYVVGLAIAYESTGDIRYANRWSRLSESWMAGTPPGFIAADVTGRRVQNWIYAYRYFVAGQRKPAVTAAFHRRLIESIHLQVEFLCANLTAARNHRTLELYAVFLAGVVFPELRRARYWREFALAEIVRNMQTDLLPDGVQCELSTDYHHLVLKNYLCVRRLAALNGVTVPQEMDDALVRALEFSMHAHKPDGIVPSLSDGDARSFLDLLLQGAELFGRDDMRYVATRGAAGKAPAQRCAHFRDSGYAVVRSGWGGESGAFDDAQYLILDCGPLGAGNHGHFDCLSFELAAFGRSLVVDPGRYTYSEAGETNWRIHFRGTAAHNTVSVDGRNQTRYIPKAIKEPSRHAIGSVRHKVAGLAPDAQFRRVASGPDCDLLHGIARSHEYDVVHERMILFVGREYWVVADWLHGAEQHCFDLRFQLSELAQGCVETSFNVSTHRILSPHLLIAHARQADCDMSVEDAHVSYRYGEKFAAPVVRFAATGSKAAFLTVLFPFRSTAPTVSIRCEPDCTDVSRMARIVVEHEGSRWEDHLVFDLDRLQSEREVAGMRCQGTGIVRTRVGAAPQLMQPTNGSPELMCR